jgi:hypothetical protein
MPILKTSNRILSTLILAILFFSTSGYCGVEDFKKLSPIIPSNLDTVPLNHDIIDTLFTVDPETKDLHFKVVENMTDVDEYMSNVDLSGIIQTYRDTIVFFDPKTSNENMVVENIYLPHELLTIKGQQNPFFDEEMISKYGQRLTVRTDGSSQNKNIRLLYRTDSEILAVYGNNNLIKTINTKPGEKQYNLAELKLPIGKYLVKHILSGDETELNIN